MAGSIFLGLTIIDSKSGSIQLPPCSVTCVILANVRSKHRSKPPSDCFFLYDNLNWLVVSTPLKSISQLGLFFPIYGKKHVPKHQPVKLC